MQQLEQIAKTRSNSEFDLPEKNPESYFVWLAKDHLNSKHILDIGCNYGNFLLNCSPNAVGIDLRNEPLRQCSNLVIQASGIDLPFKDSYFEVVFLWDVIEHVPIGKEVELLKEINRVLTTNGVLMLSTPSNNLLSILFDPAYFLRRHRHYSENEVRTMLKQSSFQLVSMTTKGDMWDIFRINLLYFRKWILRKNRLDSLQKRFNDKCNLNARSDKTGNQEIYAVVVKSK